MFSDFDWTLPGVSPQGSQVAVQSIETCTYGIGVPPLLEAVTRSEADWVRSTSLHLLLPFSLRDLIWLWLFSTETLKPVGRFNELQS